MAPVKTQRVRIQKTLVELGQAGTFPRVSYTVSGIPDELDDTIKEAPATALANEIGVVVSPDVPMGRRRVRQRESWFFELCLNFNCEVSVELFENSLLDTVPRIARDSVNKLSQVELFYQRLEVSHPVQQQPSAGTFAKFFFEAVVGRS